MMALIPVQQAYPKFLKVERQQPKTTSACSAATRSGLLARSNATQGPGGAQNGKAAADARAQAIMAANAAVLEQQQVWQGHFCVCCAHVCVLCTFVLCCARVCVCMA